MVIKAQQLDKTLLTEFSVQIADLHLRQKQLRGSISARIPQTANFVSADANVTDVQHVVLNNVGTAVIVNSWSPFFIDLTNASGQITSVPCDGLFLMYGQFTQVVIRARDVTPVRLQYAYA